MYHLPNVSVFNDRESPISHLSLDFLHPQYNSNCACVHKVKRIFHYLHKFDRRIICLFTPNSQKTFKQQMNSGSAFPLHRTQRCKALCRVIFLSSFQTAQIRFVFVFVVNGAAWKFHLMVVWKKRNYFMLWPEKFIYVGRQQIFFKSKIWMPDEICFAEAFHWFKKIKEISFCGQPSYFLLNAPLCNRAVWEHGVVCASIAWERSRNVNGTRWHSFDTPLQT